MLLEVIDGEKTSDFLGGLDGGGVDGGGTAEQSEERAKQGGSEVAGESVRQYNVFKELFDLQLFSDKHRERKEVPR